MRESQPKPIDYATPTPAKRIPLTSVGLTFYLGVISLMLYMLAAMILPAFMNSLADFKMELPLVSVMIMAGTRWLIQFPQIALFVIVPIVLPMLLVRFMHAGGPEQMRWRKRVAYLLVSLLAALVAIAAILSVLLPWASLLENVGRGK